MPLIRVRPVHLVRVGDRATWAPSARADGARLCARRWRGGALLGGALLVLSGAGAGEAQGRAEGRRGVSAAPAATPQLAPEARAVTSGSTDPLLRLADSARGVRGRIDRIPLEAAPLASLLVPGLGQARLHQDRVAAYAAGEAFLVLSYLKDTREGRRNEREYRALARDIARRNFADAPPDTVWQYYEKMEKYLESGRFSLTVNGPTVPETDTTTYNGFLWLRARRIAGVPLDDPGAAVRPEYARALAMYEQTAIRQPYRWSWRNAQLEQDLFRRTIARANDAFRRATVDISALIANHLLSAVDAFVSVRIQQLESGGVRVSARLPLP